MCSTLRLLPGRSGVCVLVLELSGVASSKVSDDKEQNDKGSGNNRPNCDIYCIVASCRAAHQEEECPRQKTETKRVEERVQYPPWDGIRCVQKEHAPEEGEFFLRRFITTDYSRGLELGQLVVLVQNLA
jgi:hypothetical protein